jgi:hypothetical protein
VGNISILNEFTPIFYEQKNLFHHLFRELYLLGICCSIIGTFPAYTAGVFRSYGTVILAVALTESLVVDKFIEHGGPHLAFSVGSFRFILSNVCSEGFNYAGKYNDMVTEILIFPVINLIECGPRSNLNFVYHLWKWCSFVPCRKYSIVLLPTDIPRIFYLKNFTAESDGWTCDLFCDKCISVYKINLQKYSFGCTKADNCKCNLCLRQPPSLKETALNLFTNSFII